MPFDPSLPAPNSPLVSAEMRGQLNGLKELIDAGAISGVVIDGVTTLPPGEAATVVASIVAGVLHLSFGIPQGAAGTNGTNGADGAQGPQGPMGAVTPQNLDDAIATTARNPNALGPFTGTFSDPPTQAELVAFAAYVEEMRGDLVR